MNPNKNPPNPPLEKGELIHYSTEFMNTTEQIKIELSNLKNKGAEYADARFYPLRETESLTFLQGNLKECRSTSTTGIGIRVLYNGAWGFASSSSTENLQMIFETSFENARAASNRLSFPIKLADRKPLTAGYISPRGIDPFDVSIAEKLNFLREIDNKLKDKNVAQRISYITSDKQKIIFIDSDGAHIEKDICEMFAGMKVIGVESDGNSQERSYDIGGTGYGTRGWEILTNNDDFSNNADRIVDELSQVLIAKQAPKDTRSVILLPGIMFLQTHEVIGHALELDRILGYELSYAGGSFVRLEDFGNLRYGSDKLTVRADGTLPNSPGSYGYDDDGVECQDTVLIDKGILKNAITSRQTVIEANEKAGKNIFNESGGCARASNFNRIPLERMTNINIEPGNDGSLDDIIASTENGIVLDGARSWSIGSNREQFHFACEIGWLVENGIKKEVVKNPTYSSDTLPFWRSLSAVGDKSTAELVYVPNCGKGLPSQQMYLGHHIPVCRFDNVETGE